MLEAVEQSAKALRDAPAQTAEVVDAADEVNQVNEVVSAGSHEGEEVRM